MPRGQTPTPVERAQAELDKAEEALAKFAERAQKKVDARDSAKAKYLALDAEVAALAPEYDFAKANVALLRSHPLLGGSGQPAAPVYTPVADAPLNVTQHVEGPVEPSLQEQATVRAAVDQVVAQVETRRAAAPVEQAKPVIESRVNDSPRTRPTTAPAPEPQRELGAFEPTPRDPNKKPLAVVPDFDLEPDETLADTVLPDEPEPEPADDVSPMTDGDPEQDAPAFDFDPFAAEAKPFTEAAPPVQPKPAEVAPVPFDL